ncbi:membrane protein (plasmid) [Fulvitalea axinellae]|uniref:Membrane protein n=1 Tax=Fulvitalea axinellae TaxID=1182444 RepID=A0AAU9CUV3_9BACT|nr:membrane protein [Fulvitalea axinellae]
MDSQDKQGFFANLRYDAPSSIVVFLVAMPLCLGIALASGAPLFSGIIAGIVGGIVVGSLSGSALGVSGPAAGLAVIIVSAINDLGSFEALLLAVVFSGIIQIALGFLRAGVIGYYFPTAVIRGMLSGIGVFIILKQIPHAFGYDRDPVGDFSFLQVDGENTISGILNMLNFISPGALIIAAISMAILILWEKPFISRLGFTKIIKGPLVAVLAGIGLNVYFADMPEFALKQDQLVALPIAGSFGGFMDLLTKPDFSQITNPQIYIVALTIAVVGSIETLLSVEAADKLDPQKRVTPTNRELKAQGVGNLISGLLGGLPVTQVIVRSSVNVQTGGRTKASAIMHGVLLFVCALSIPKLLNLIPFSSLASILIVVGFKLAKPALFKEMYSRGFSQFVPFVVTILGIVFIDLLMGIALGMIVAIFHILWNNYKTPYFFEAKDYRPGEPIRIRLAEDVSFLNKAGVLRTLKHIPDHSTVIIDASNTRSVHIDVLEIIDDYKANAETKGIELILEGFDKLGTYDDPVKQVSKVVGSDSKNKVA